MIRRAGIAVAFAAVVALVAWTVVLGPTGGGAQDAASAPDRLIYRGYTDAPQGTVLVSGEVWAGQIVLETRIAVGDQVKRDEVIAVLSNYPPYLALVHRYEGELAKAKLQREAMVSGYRNAEIAMQQVKVTSAETKANLKELELKRSGEPPDQKKFSLNVSQGKAQQELAKLKVLKETLATDLAVSEADIRATEAKLDEMRAHLEQGLVRSPIDGLVVEINARRGEKVEVAVAKIVDMSQIRVLVDVNEVNIGRIAVGQRVEVTFHGTKSIFGGAVARIPPVVKRLQRAVYALGNPGESRVVTVEIEFDNPESIPKVLGREAAVTFF
jgi:multidrug resistance efflux pump